VTPCSSVGAYQCYGRNLSPIYQFPFLKKETGDFYERWYTFVFKTLRRALDSGRLVTDGQQFGTPRNGPSSQADGSSVTEPFSSFYETEMFITAFKTAHHSTYNELHESSPHPPIYFTTINFNIILPSTASWQ
jgi:hypothetical protein